MQKKTQKLPTPLESAIQKTICEYLTLRKYFWWRNNTGAFTRDGHFYNFGKKGSGDIFVLLPHKFCSIEVKRKGGRPTDDQLEFITQVTDLGHLAFVAESVDDVIEHGL